MGKAIKYYEIDGKINGEIWDTGIAWKSGDTYWLEWIGLGITKRISKKQYEYCVENGRLIT